MSTLQTTPTLSITPSRMRLMTVIQHMVFGRIENLIIRDGDPQFEPPPVIVTELKLGADHHGTTRSTEVRPHPAVRDLLRTLDRCGNGTIRCLEIRHGLPFRIEIDGELAA